MAAKRHGGKVAAKLGGKAAKLAAKWRQSWRPVGDSFQFQFELMPGLQFGSVQFQSEFSSASVSSSAVDARQTVVARLAAKRRQVGGEEASEWRQSGMAAKWRQSLAAKSVTAAKRHGGKLAAKLGGKVRHGGKASWRQRGGKARRQLASRRQSVMAAKRRQREP
eukprot:gene14342-biopygen4897